MIFMEDCIFCKIVGDKLPSFKVFEDTDILAFLDINPIAEGHTLVVSKKHFVNIFDIDDELLKKIILISKKISKKMLSELNIQGVNIFQRSGKAAEPGVSHFHLHIVPRSFDDGINFEKWWQTKNKEIGKKKMELLAKKLEI